MRNNGSGVRRCQECRTDYRIDFKDHDSYGLAMFFTRWKDLGDRPESEVWTQNSVEPQAQLEGLLQYGDISSAFADSDDFKFDSLLTSGNKAHLYRFRKYYLGR